MSRKISDCVLLTQDFNIIELKNCLMNFKEGKSPGEDGLPLEKMDFPWNFT